MSTAVYLYCPICDKSSGSVNHGSDFFSRLLRSYPQLSMFARSPVYDDLAITPIWYYDGFEGPITFLLAHEQHPIQIKDEYGHLYNPLTGERAPDKK